MRAWGWPTALTGASAPCPAASSSASSWPAGLDQPNREALLSIITDLKDQGISLIISTHDLVLAQETCEQAALLAGRQIAFGPRDDVLVARYIDEAYGGHGTTRLLGLRSGVDTQERS